MRSLSSGLKTKLYFAVVFDLFKLFLSQTAGFNDSKEVTGRQPVSLILPFDRPVLFGFMGLVSWELDSFSAADCLGKESGCI
jgi:hypothetical protein